MLLKKGLFRLIIKIFVIYCTSLVFPRISYLLSRSLKRISTSSLTLNLVVHMIGNNLLLSIYMIFVIVVTISTAFCLVLNLLPFHLYAFSLTSSNSTIDLSDLWHNCLGHVHYQMTHYMSAQQLVDNVLDLPLVKRQCIPCILPKKYHNIFLNTLLPVVHVFFNLFILTFVDLLYLPLILSIFLLLSMIFSILLGYSFCNQNLRPFLDLNKFHALVSTQFLSTISVLCSDCGKKYMSIEFL